MRTVQAEPGHFGRASVVAAIEALQRREIIVVTDDDNVRAPANRCAQSPAMMQEMRLFAQTLRGVFGVVISRALSFTLSRWKASA